MCGPTVLNLGDTAGHLGVVGMTAMQALKKRKKNEGVLLTRKQSKAKSAIAENPVRALLGTSCITKT